MAVTNFAVVAGARPNFMKIGPIVHALRERGASTILVHTGQHYDSTMSGQFFEDLQIPIPDVDLGVGSGSHAEQTASVLVRFERFLLRNTVNVVVVVGDVNSTVAAAITAAKLHIPVAHVEAGLRSRDRNMPEEINRLLTDRISRWLFTTSEGALRNLIDEGVHPDWIFFVGNVMIDALFANIGRAREMADRVQTNLAIPQKYALLTLHRPSNVDDPIGLEDLLRAVALAVDGMTVLFPCHPRTRDNIQEHNVSVPDNVHMVAPMSYLEFIGLVDRALLVFTDSGGIQEETSALGVPCLTLRDSTERPVTCELGTNQLVGTDPERIISAAHSQLGTQSQSPANIPLWDGQSAQRIVDILLEEASAHG